METIEKNICEEVLKCSICGKEVKRENDKLVRTCEHLEDVIISEMVAVMKGRGTVLS